MGLLLLLGGVSDPNPQSLFVNNELGLAIDIGDRNGASQAKIDSGLTGATFKAAYPNHSLYQDANGVTPAIQPGDPVGLVIDSSRGGLENLGSDLVSNGTFATDTVWTKGANWTIGSGVATKTGGAANNLTQTIGSTAGQWYRITATVTRSAGTLTVSLGTSGTTYAITATGTYTFLIAAGSSTQTLTFAGDSSFAGTVDDVTARLIPGIHPYQTTSGSRPALCRTPDGGRRNLLTYSEQFDVTSGGWTKLASSISSNQVTAPDGTATADNWIINSGVNVNIPAVGLFTSGANSYAATNSATALSAVAHTASIYVKAGSGLSHVQLRVATTASLSGTSYGTVVKLSDGTVVATDGTTNVTSLSGGWYRIQFTFTPSAGNYYTGVWAWNDASKTTNGTEFITLWGAQLETGSSATTYQKVGLTSDVTESGKRDCWGLLADGSDDSLITTSVDFSSTDKMTVMAGVRKNSDGLDAALMELTIGSSNGWFAIYAPGSSTAAKFQITSQGTTARAVFTTSSTWNAPVTAVVTGQGDISGDSVLLRLNGSQIASSVLDQGSGNYANSVVYILSRSASMRLSGILYTLIIRGAATPTGTIADFERNLLAKRAGVSY
jgi:hypothetical protein